VAALLAENSVNLGDVDNGVLEKHDVHLLDLGLRVVLGQRFVETFAQNLEVTHFLIVVVVFVTLEEVNKNGINFLSVIQLSGAGFLVVDLEVLSELLVQDTLKLVLISNGNKTIVEHSQDFVAPKLDQVIFGVLVGLLGAVKTLEHLRDVSHIEDVVGVGRCGQELLLNLVEQLDGSHGEGLAKGLDLLGEGAELKGSKGLEYSLQVGLVRHHVVYKMELGNHTGSNFSSATAGWAHSSDNLQVAHEVLNDLLAIEPVAVVNPLADELNWGLSAELFLLGHVQVIDKCDCLEL